MEVGKHVDMTQTKKYRVVYAAMSTYFVRHFEVAQCQTSNQPVPDLNVESARAELWEEDQTRLHTRRHYVVGYFNPS